MSLRTQSSGIVENESGLKKFFSIWQSETKHTFYIYIHSNSWMSIGKFLNYIYFILEIPI